MNVSLILRTGLVLLCLAAITTAQDRSVRLMEAKLYVEGAEDLNRLGYLAGDLYICSRGMDENGAYLLLVTDADQLARIDQCGLETRVTWTDLDDKFELLTGVDPEDPGRFQDFGYYHTYWEMRDSVNAFAANYPDICSLYAVGVSSQGRDILCLKMSDNVATEEDEPACFFTGSTHGNEPMGTSIVIAFLQEILAGYGTDPVSTWLVDNREIYTVPILNPDCSVFCSDSAGANIYWRKNRRVVVPPHVGVDPARNYGYRWGCDDVGSSPDPATHAYRGPYAWSDAEASAALSLQSAHRFRTEQNFHAFGGYNCYPWSWTLAAPPEQALLQEMVDTFQMYNEYHDTLTGQASHVLYYANGTQLDWGFADTADKFISYSLVIEADSWFWACWNDSVRHRQECDWNVPTLYYLARVAGVYFDPVSVTVNDTGIGNSSGRLDPGETADIWFAIRNRAVHPLDSAYGISAKLVSLDTLVNVLDSVKPFPEVQRLAQTDNAASQFRVRASGAAQAGDTIPLLLEAGFIDAGSAIMMPVGFEIVLGDDTTGVEEKPEGERAKTESRIPAIVRGVLFWSAAPSLRNAGDVALHSADGRRVMELSPGSNDVSRLAPGVYFIETKDRTGSAKVLVTR
ncbi:MAG: hypothetical protein JSU73_03180 [candidate division WOR-3 bacterium]|nr:MAG: hypothetical protein JSU73_03180 [candidate division WOR-3 bacterium]